jgi:hypothetical protein
MEVESGYSSPFFVGTADRNVRPSFRARWMLSCSRFDPCRDRALFCEAIRWWHEARHRPANGCVPFGNMRAVLGAFRLSGTHFPGTPPFLKGTKRVAGAWRVATPPVTGPKRALTPEGGDRGMEVESGYSSPFFVGTADRNVRPYFLTRWMLSCSRFDPCRDRALFCEAIRWWREARHRPANGCVPFGNMKAVLGAFRLSGTHIPGTPPFLKGTKRVAGAWRVAPPPDTGPKRALTPEGGDRGVELESGYSNPFFWDGRPECAPIVSDTLDAALQPLRSLPGSRVILRSDPVVARSAPPTG